MQWFIMLLKCYAHETLTLNDTRVPRLRLVLPLLPNGMRNAAQFKPVKTIDLGPTCFGFAYYLTA